ncbi:MAG: hypothetical protein ACP5IA_13775 [Sediminispirochaetaceae bacterium]
MKAGTFSDKKNWRLLPTPLLLPAALLLGTALLAGALAACTPEMGWNSDFILTTNLRVGTAYAGETIEAGETVYYDFISSAPASHTITVTPALIDVAIELFTEPSYSDPGDRYPEDSAGAGGAETITSVALVSPRKYYIAVTEIGGSAGEFDIQITYP